MNNTLRTSLLILALLAIGSGIWWLEAMKPPSPSAAALSAAAIPLPDAASTAVQALAAQDAGDPRALDFVDPTGFINTPAFSLKDLVGNKVVLIDFWTYSCINCVRTIPYLEAWYQKYKDAGLVVIGVHSPEFDFEKIVSNVQAAVTQYGITYPVVLDSNMGTWDAYQNQYWPEEYLIDIDGFVVDNPIGEGDYTQTEEAIQAALKERNQVLGFNTPVPTGLVNPAYVVTANESKPLSEETYFGSNRNRFFGNGAQGGSGTQTFTAPALSAVAQNTFYLGGTWDIEPQFAENTSGDASISYGYSAQNVYFVAASASGTTTVQVLIDGKLIPAAMRGSDVDAQGFMHIGPDRLYHIVQDAGWGEHTLQLIVQTPGLQAYTFTFG